MKVKFEEAKVDFNVVDTRTGRKGTVQSVVGPRSAGVVKARTIKVTWADGKSEDFEWETPSHIEIHSLY